MLLAQYGVKLLLWALLLHKSVQAGFEPYMFNASAVLRLPSSGQIPNGFELWPGNVTDSLVEFCSVEGNFKSEATSAETITGELCYDDILRGLRGVLTRQPSIGLLAPAVPLHERVHFEQPRHNEILEVDIDKGEQVDISIRCNLLLLLLYLGTKNSGRANPQFPKLSSLNAQFFDRPGSMG